MAYVTGAAANIADLATALRNACVANGWLQAENVIWKGGSYFEITTDVTFVLIHGGTGQSAGVLSEKSPKGARLGGPFVTFPVTYEISLFENPDEVYMVINFNSDFYQQMSFGTSDVAGAGGGPWYTGAHNTRNLATSIVNEGMNITKEGIYNIGMWCFSNVSTNCLGLFQKATWADEVATSFIYTNANGVAGWYGYNSGPGTMRLINGATSWIAALLFSLPSAFNNTNVLLPIKALLDMGSNGRATVVNPRNARFCRIDYNAPGDIVTYGGDRWKVYPWLRKNTAIRDGEHNASIQPANATPPTHSGTFGYAIRYDGV